jgi:hypothetical protein
MTARLSELNQENAAKPKPRMVFGVLLDEQHDGAAEQIDLASGCDLIERALSMTLRQSAGLQTNPSSPRQTTQTQKTGDQSPVSRTASAVSRTARGLLFSKKRIARRGRSPQAALNQELRKLDYAMELARFVQAGRAVECGGVHSTRVTLRNPCHFCIAVLKSHWYWRKYFTRAENGLLGTRARLEASCTTEAVSEKATSWSNASSTPKAAGKGHQPHRQTQTKHASCESFFNAAAVMPHSSVFSSNDKYSASSRLDQLKVGGEEITGELLDQETEGESPMAKSGIRIGMLEAWKGAVTLLCFLIQLLLSLASFTLLLAWAIGLELLPPELRLSPGGFERSSCALTSWLLFTTASFHMVVAIRFNTLLRVVCTVWRCRRVITEVELRSATIARDLGIPNRSGAETPREIADAAIANRVTFMKFPGIMHRLLGLLEPEKEVPLLQGLSSWQLILHSFNCYTNTIPIMFMVTYGLSFFVFIMFTYVMWQNPDKVYFESGAHKKVSEGQSWGAGIIQVVNIWAHFVPLVHLGIYKASLDRHGDGHSATALLVHTRASRFRKLVKPEFGGDNGLFVEISRAACILVWLLAGKFKKGKEGMVKGKGRVAPFTAGSAKDTEPGAHRWSSSWLARAWAWLLTDPRTCLLVLVIAPFTIFWMSLAKRQPEQGPLAGVMLFYGLPFMECPATCNGTYDHAGYTSGNVVSNLQMHPPEAMMRAVSGDVALANLVLEEWPFSFTRAVLAAGVAANSTGAGVHVHRLLHCKLHMLHVQEAEGPATPPAGGYDFLRIPACQGCMQPTCPKVKNAKVFQHFAVCLLIWFSTHFAMGLSLPPQHELDRSSSTREMLPARWN